ncbi:RES domain-containing protein, partial [Mycobacterium tuberculosis]
RISATIRTARSRSSGGYLLDEPPDMTPSFPRTGVSGHAGAVQVDPFEVRRRVGRVAVTLQVLDLTDERTRSHLGVDETDLLSDDYTTTQAIAAARDANFDAVLAPAAALPGCQTLAVFVHALPNIEPERSEVRQPPPRLANLLPLIRPHEHMPDSVRRLLATLTRAGAEAIRRRRR